MYNLPYFKENDKGAVLQFMKQHPFAMLIGSLNNTPVATQVPFLVEEKEGKLYLVGHIMKGTDHYKAFEKNKTVLCVFTGPHSYVSASLYTDPKTASTWNYMSVHAKGTLSFLNEEALRNILEKTTTLFENNPDSPSSFHHLPAEYISKLIKAIVAIEVEVTGIDNVFKLSQNRDEKSYHNIINHLKKGEGESQQLAKEMEQRASSLFHE